MNNCLIHIHELISPQFNRNGKLIKVNFESNLINDLKANSFESFDSLVLRDNKLVELAVLGMSTMTFLDLGKNSLKKLDSDIFNSLTELKTLLLDQNRINLIDKDIFMNLSRLEELNMSHNSIEELSSNSFIGLNRVSTTRRLCAIYAIYL
jgi:Leucine-rich repeat (LRR) protein